MLSHKEFFNDATARKYVKKLQNGSLSPKEEREVYNYFDTEYFFYIQKQDLKYNHIYDQEDMKSEFMIQAWTALYRAKLTVGNPLAFALQRAKFATIDYIRKINSQKLILVCPQCGAEYTYDRRNKVCKNPKCKNDKESENQLTSKEKEDIPELGIEALASVKSAEDITEKFMMDALFNEIILYIKDIDELSFYEKSVAINSLTYRHSFYDEAKYKGKSHSWSMTFEKKMQKILSPLKGRLSMAL
jgi:DNA-directed RNA polymerase specialized sigma24 family protein